MMFQSSAGGCAYSKGFIGSRQGTASLRPETPKMKQRRPTNPELLNAIGYLMKAGKQYQTPLWITVASFLGKSRRTRIVLNLGQVSKNLKGGEVIVVPGKVLGSGEPKEKLTIAAFKFSPRALVKVEKAGGRCIPFSRLLAEQTSDYFDRRTCQRRNKRNHLLRPTGST